MEELASSVQRIADNQARTDARLQQLAETTDARIAALTSAIGEYIREMHEREGRKQN